MQFLKLKELVYIISDVFETLKLGFNIHTNSYRTVAAMWSTELEGHFVATNGLPVWFYNAQ